LFRYLVKLKQHKGIKFQDINTLKLIQRLFNRVGKNRIRIYTYILYVYIRIFIRIFIFQIFSVTYRSLTKLNFLRVLRQNMHLLFIISAQLSLLAINYCLNALIFSFTKFL